jgi:hypothetical protein
VGADVSVREKLPEAVPGHPEPSDIPVRTKDPDPLKIVGILMVNVLGSKEGNNPDPP